MTGRLKGAASRITAKYPKAIYIYPLCLSQVKSLRSEMLQHQ